jgi:hypothetical protein
MAAGLEVKVPSCSVEVVERLLVAPWVTTWPAVARAKTQSLTVVGVPTTRPENGEIFALKIHEPYSIVPLAVPEPEAIVNSGDVLPAAGAVNLTVVAAVVPNAGTAPKVKPVLTAVKLAVAAPDVVGEIARAGIAAKEILTVATGASSPPPQAAKPQAKATASANLVDSRVLLKGKFILIIP